MEYRQLTAEDEESIGALARTLVEREALDDEDVGVGIMESLSWMVDQGAVYEGTKDGKRIGWARVFPLREGRDATIHPIMSLDGGLNVEEMALAVRGFTDCLMREHDLKRVTVPVIETPGLIDKIERVLESAGYRCEGKLEDAAYLAGASEPYDLRLYGILRREVVTYG